MSKTIQSAADPLFTRVGASAAMTERDEIDVTPEAQVLLLLMQAAVRALGRDAAFDLWDEAAEMSLFSYGGRYRLAWTNARDPFDNHAPNAIDRHKP